MIETLNTASEEEISALEDKQQNKFSYSGLVWAQTLERDNPSQHWCYFM